MKPFALGALCIGTLALGVSMVLLAMVLLKIMPQGLVVLILAVLGLVILKVLIGILSRGLAVHPAVREIKSKTGMIPEQPAKEVIEPIQVSG